MPQQSPPRPEGLGRRLLAEFLALPAVSWSHHDRLGGHLLLGEVVATVGLVLLVLALPRSRQEAAARMGPRSRPWRRCTADSPSCSPTPEAGRVVAGSPL